MAKTLSDVKYFNKKGQEINADTWTDLNTVSVEISRLLLVCEEVPFETVDDLTLIAEVIVSRRLHFSRTQIRYLKVKRKA